jgi:hypothetical protein
VLGIIIIIITRVFSGYVYQKATSQLVQREGSRQHQLSLLRMTASHRVIC